MITTPSFIELFPKGFQTNSDRLVQEPEDLFAAVNGYFPNFMEKNQIDCKAFANRVIRQYRVPKKHMLIRQDYDNKRHRLTATGIYIALNKEFWVYINKLRAEVNILYSPKVPAQHLNFLVQLMKTCHEKWEEEARIGLVVAEQRGFSINHFKIKPFEVDLELHYNDDLPEIDRLLKKKLFEQRENGLILLHGAPGTGKTSYIRHLVNQRKRDMVYLPPDMASVLASPMFIPFLARQGESILIIEDAESILMKRNQHSHNAISNLLNLSDGLLADCLNLGVICTFNTELKAIDPALLRKGRLMAKYEFKKLRQPKARQLINHLGHEYTATTDMSLAEIYNLSEKNFEEEREWIGYRN